MKHFVILFLLVSYVVVAGILPGVGISQANSNKSGIDPQQSNEKPSWEIPIAAGIYYPSDGPVPDHPMRYYRVRCWPGCHTGSNYGKYPDKALKDKPIFPTSAASSHPIPQAVKE